MRVEDDGAEERAALQKEADEAARKRGWFEPALPPDRGAVLPVVQLEPRLVNVQATEARRRGQHGGELGRVAWEEHVEACARAGRDAERVAARGGWGYADLCLLLGREPRTWRAW